jgi:hypothetical protein
MTTSSFKGGEGRTVFGVGRRVVVVVGVERERTHDRYVCENKPINKHANNRPSIIIDRTSYRAVRWHRRPSTGRLAPTRANAAPPRRERRVHRIARIGRRDDYDDASLSEREINGGMTK